MNSDMVICASPFSSLRSHQLGKSLGNVGPTGLFRLVDETGAEVHPVPELPDGLAVRLLEAMLFQRALDQRMLNLQRQGRIGFYGTAKGQEMHLLRTY